MLEKLINLYGVGQVINTYPANLMEFIMFKWFKNSLASQMFLLLIMPIGYGAIGDWLDNIEAGNGLRLGFVMFCCLSFAGLLFAVFNQVYDKYMK